jgi:hypothetical protein
VTTLLVLVAVSGWVAAFHFWKNANKSADQMDDALELIRELKAREEDLSKGGPHR